MEMNQKIKIQGLTQNSENREFIITLLSKAGMNAELTATFV